MKDFILDTNVILNDCMSIYNFEEHNVVIPMTVIEELDHFKKNMDELGRNARKFSHLMDDLRGKGSLVTGVEVNKKGGALTVGFCREDALKLLPTEMDKSIADNRILAIALFNQQYSKNDTVLVTKDTNLRIKADALGVTAEDYENGKVDFDTLYTGVKVCSEGYLPTKEEMAPNEYVRVCDAADGSTVSVLRYDATLEDFVPLREDLESWGLTPLNDEQAMAMDLLLNDDIKLVTLVGKAGTGKGLVSLSTALRLVTDDFKYKKLLVAKPVYPMGKDIGYLPGSAEEKLNPYMQSIYDGIEFLMSGTASVPIRGVTRKGKKSKDEEEKEVGGLGKGHLELMAAGILEVEPLMYIRGRSIPNVIMILDEIQNMTKHEIKTAISRVSKGTKIICIGDPEQIDNPYLDASSNGLTYIVEKFRGEKIAGHVTLVHGERSELATIASNIL